jgi:phage baseplate assembly protein W
MRDIIGTGLAFPFGVDARGRVALVRDELDVEQAIKLILETAPGERPMRPEFGCAVHDMVFERVDAATSARIADCVRAALHRWEPRVDVIDVAFDMREPRLEISITYRIRATNAKRNLVYPFYVIPEEDER